MGFTLRYIKFFKRKRTNLSEATTLSGKDIINVDIQPEYEGAVGFNITEWLEYLNEQKANNDIIFLYNGFDTLGMVSESEYIIWLFENGASEELIDQAIFYDKGYAFFRYCMDSGIDEDAVANIVRYMHDNNINDSRDMDEDAWNDYIDQYSDEDVRELLEMEDDMIHIPDLMDFLKNYNNIVLTGGGLNECLKEVEIALMAMNKPYTTLQQYTY